MHYSKNSRAPKCLVENRTSFGGPNSEVCIYDTYKKAKRVKLDSDQLVFCGMVSGKKVVHTGHRRNGQVFLPHESFVMAPGEKVEIDFPEASLQLPTTCLTIEIETEKVESIRQRLSDSFSNVETQHCIHTQPQHFHTPHSQETQRLLERLVKLFSENHPDRDTLIELNITELVIRMLRHNTRSFLISHSGRDPERDSLAAALDWINSHLSKPLDIEQLCRHVAMSRSRMYAAFKRYFACSPVELQQQLRLKCAAERLLNGESMTSICYDLGFSHPSHFCHRFKNFYGCTASEYKKRHGEEVV